MSPNDVVQIFQRYEEARLLFVRQVAEVAAYRSNSEALQDAGASTTLRPLLLDPLPAVRQTAALALGRLANHSSDLAEAVVDGAILPQLVGTLTTVSSELNVTRSRSFVELADPNSADRCRAAAFVLRAVAQHSPKLAWAVVDCGGADALVACLNDCDDSSVKEAAAWTLGSICRHGEDLARAVDDAGAIPLLASCVQEPDLVLKRVATSTLSELCRHSEDLASKVVNTGIVLHFTQMMLNPDTKLKRHVFAALCHIAEHSPALAASVSSASLLPAAVSALAETDQYVKKNCASYLRAVVRHGKKFAESVNSVQGGTSSLVRHVDETQGSVRIPAIVALGHMASHSQNLSSAVIAHKGEVSLSALLSDHFEEDPVRSAAAWALGQIGRHGPEHAAAVAASGALPKLMQCMLAEGDSTEVIRTKARKALLRVLDVCTHEPSLEDLLLDRSAMRAAAAGPVLESIICQFGKLLPHSSRARRRFMTSGCLTRILEVRAEPWTRLAQLVCSVTGCYPPEALRYYSSSAVGLDGSTKTSALPYRIA